MGVSQFIYLGPYVIVPDIKKQEKIIAKKCSNNGRHEFPKDAKFCPICGGIIVPEEQTRPFKYSAIQALSEDVFIDSLFPFGEILQPNQSLKGGSNIRIDPHNSITYVIPSDQIKEEDMVAFKIQYKKEFEFLAEKGFNIEYRWGLVINWY